MNPPTLRVECACGNVMKFPTSQGGQTVACPHCGAPNRIEPLTRTCPFCAETIQADAVKCRHCGEFVDGRPRVTAQPARPTQDPGGVGILVIGILALALGFCGVILGPIAWIMGNGYKRDCEARRIQPNGMGVAGRICGMIATILWGGILALYVFILIIGLAATGFR